MSEAVIITSSACYITWSSSAFVALAQHISGVFPAHLSVRACCMHVGGCHCHLISMHIPWSSSAFLAFAQHMLHLSLHSAHKVHTGYWAGRFDTWLPIELTSKGVVVSFLFFSFLFFSFLFFSFLFFSFLFFSFLFFSFLFFFEHWVNTLSAAGRLLAWATDIEAQLGLQRQELRRSRIELASAQEVLEQLQPKCKVAHVTAMLKMFGRTLTVVVCSYTQQHLQQPTSVVEHSSQLRLCKAAQPGKHQSVFKRETSIFQHIAP